jgi:hypothetical protein
MIFRQFFTLQIPPYIKKTSPLIEPKTDDHAWRFPTAQESGTHTIGDYANASDADLRLKNRPPIFVLSPSKRHLTCGSASAFKQLPSSVPVPQAVPQGSCRSFCAVAAGDTDWFLVGKEGNSDFIGIPIPNEGANRRRGKSQYHLC